MKETLKQDLQALTCEGNVAKLPTANLNNYAELKKVLTQATGKYKKNTFVFPSPAQVIIDKLLGGSTINFKKDFQFFPTPQPVADRMAQDVVFNKKEMYVLEPGAGHGALIDALLRVCPADVKLIINTVELSDLNYDILMDKYKDEDRVNLIIKGDFLEHEPARKYDLIIANPPFTKNQDIDHVRHMHSMLADGGQLLTITSKSWTFGSQKKQVAFREWLDDLGVCYTALDSGEFKASGTNVASMYLNF